MNREERRRYNKKHGTKHDRAWFDRMLLNARLVSKTGLDVSEMARQQHYIHFDNELLAPNGTTVKLNYDDIYARPQDDLTDKFKEFVESHKDMEMHITREDVVDSLVSLEEDENRPRFLFDLYADLLIETEDGFKHPVEIDKGFSDYVPALGVDGIVNKPVEPKEEIVVQDLKEDN